MSILICLVFGAVFLYLYLRHSSTEDNLKGIPGPKGWPIFGNLFQMLRKPFHLITQDWFSKYGPVFRFDFLGREVVGVCGYEALREVLLTRGQDFAGRPNDNAKDLELFRADGLFAADLSPFWRRQRSHVHSALKLYGSGLATFEDIASQVLDGLVEAFQAKDQQPFDCFDDLHKTLSAFLCTLIAGKHVSRNDPAVHKIKEIDVMARSGSYFLPQNLVVGRFFWLRVFYSGYIRDRQTAIEQCLVFWDTFIRSVKMTEEFKNGHGLLARLSKQIEENQPGEEDGSGTVDEQENSETSDGSDDVVKALVLNLIAAGAATTASSLYALLNIFLHYPDVQERIAEELLKIGLDKRITLANKGDLPYTRAVVLELLRFTSIAPQGLTHKAMVDTEIQGYKIPKGSLVMPCLYAHHTNVNEWDEPHAFKPERFLDADGSLLAADHPICKKVLAFGAGPRVCLGEQLARNRLFLFIATIVQKFRFTPPSGEPLSSCDPRDWEASVVFPPKQYRICAIPRDA